MNELEAAAVEGAVEGLAGSAGVPAVSPDAAVEALAKTATESTLTKGQAELATLSAEAVQELHHIVQTAAQDATEGVEVLLGRSHVLAVSQKLAAALGAFKATAPSAPLIPGK